jgi:hypothetical protein
MAPAITNLFRFYNTLVQAKQFEEANRLMISLKELCKAEGLLCNTDEDVIFYRKFANARR